jgi:hypothetical protein
VARGFEKGVVSMTENIDFTKDSEYKRLFGEKDLKKEKVCLYESKSNEKTMERKGRDTSSTKTSRKNSQ